MKKNVPLTKLPNNLSLASLFHQMARCYRFLGREEYFRAQAYENAAKVLENMQEDISSYATPLQKPDSIGGIGVHIAEKIREYLKTGTIRTYLELKKKVPVDLLELLDVTGMGPATLKILHGKLGIQNREDLEEALKSNALQGLKGFGEKKIELLSSAVKGVKAPGRIPIASARLRAEELLSVIRKIPGVQQAAIAGSLRREKETIGDIDIVLAAPDRDRRKILFRLLNLPGRKKVLAKGNTKVSLILKNPDIQVDIRMVNENEFGSALLYFTGSREHTIKLRTMAKERGLRMNEYGIFESASGRKLAGRTEEEIYHLLHLSYIPPRERSGKGEIEKAVLSPLRNLRRS